MKKFHHSYVMILIYPLFVKFHCINFELFLKKM